MAIFEYEALTQGGRKMAGTLEAGSVDQVKEQLTEMKLTVGSINLASKKTIKSMVGRNEFALFNQQLASLANAGIPLERGLRELADDAGTPAMRRLIKNVADDLESGMEIDAAFEKHSKHFPVLYGRIVKAGVKTGKLSEMLLSLNRHLEMGLLTRKILLDAICYPVFILLMTIAISTGLFIFVTPEFRNIFDDLGSTLPDITRFILSITDHIIPFWTFTGIIIASLIVLKTCLVRTKGGRVFVETIYMKIPVIGRIYHYSMLSRLADSIALLISSGCDIPESLRLSAESIGNEKIKQESDLVSQQVESGESLLEAGQFCSTIPRLFTYSMHNGAQRNELQDNLYSLSNMYELQARAWQGRLSGILSPLLLFLVGGFICITITAMFMPMVQLLGDLGG
ncbi:MAG: type II secretion system F family protein [Phycisphaerae bacterium]|nr:type II secretion system F family protein [Phycisphaerae bacterium]